MRTAKLQRLCQNHFTAITVQVCIATNRFGKMEIRFLPEMNMLDFQKWRNFTSAGCLKHAPALIAFAAPTTNSFKRLVPGFEAPVNLAYSARNRSAAVRIPMFSQSPKAKRLEFRPPDPSCNPYLTFAALLMAGLDGVQNRIDPGEPLDKDIYDLSPEELKDVPSLPGNSRRSADRARK